MEQIKKKRIADSIAEQVYVIRPEYMNGGGRLFGGRLMEWIDGVAGLVAIRHAQSHVITAAVDNLKFIRGAYQNDLVVLRGKLTYVGNTSMEVRVDTYVEDYFEGTRRPINRAYLIMVAVDEEGKPRKVPEIILENESERAEWEAGEKRRQMRNRRRKEGF